ncbi:hypothetical protein C7S13_8795 [Burkholderia cepacia]|nr:hypothetical protein [Burkholderia cepacia]
MSDEKRARPGAFAYAASRFVPDCSDNSRRESLNPNQL